MDFGTGDEATDLVNVFSNSIRKEDQRQSPFMREGHYTFTYFSCSYIMSSSPCHTVASRNPDHTDRPQESH